MTYSQGQMEVGEKAMAMLGLSQIAYIRPVNKGASGYAVCAADGRQLAVFPNYPDAFFTARLHDLTPVNVH